MDIFVQDQEKILYKAYMSYTGSAKDFIYLTKNNEAT